ncbi:MAG: hypothetical protein WAV04_00825 [Candidatus Microsaccharimonas sp.]
MKKILTFAVTLVSLSILACLLPTNAYAANGADFNPGYIIDDSVFYNSSTMSPDQIQNFLNSKNPNCDYNGTQPASDWGYPGMTHAQFAEHKRNGTNGFSQDTGFHAPPYKCLTMYTQNTPQMEAASGLCNSLSAGSNRSAAQIINDVAKACGINPQVLLILLEKEQSLVTDKWPLNRQLEHATGFACPDTAPCDPQYSGIFYQIYYAARQFKIYQKFPNSYNYRAGRTNIIKWSPNDSCGTSEVYIQNQATAGLYIYTPYRPNAAALNNLYGTGDGCSAYGNRNFWRIFTDWFGSTKDPFNYSLLKLTSALSVDSSELFTDKPQTFSYTISNTSNIPIDLGEAFITVRGPQGQNLDITSDKNVVVPASGTYTFSKQWSSPYAGQHTFNIIFNKTGVGYTTSLPIADSPSTVRSMTKTIQPSLRVISNLSVSPGQPTVGQAYTANFSVRNDSNRSIDIGYPFVIVRGPNGQNLDVGIDTSARITIPANSTYNYSKQWTTNVSGLHRLIIASWVPESTQLLTIPASAGVNREANMTAKPSLRVISNLSVDPEQPIQGKGYTATFAIRNDSNQSVDIGYPFVTVRGPQGQNLDVGIDNSTRVIIPANSTYNYSKPWTTNIVGVHTLSILSWMPDKNQMLAIPADTGVSRDATMTVKPSLRVVSNLSVSPSQPIVGQAYTASFSIRNDSNQSADIGYPFVIVRGPNGQNVDIGIDNSARITIAANSTYNYSKQWTTKVTGLHTLSIASWIPERSQVLTIPANTGVNRDANMTVISN